jgi:hypothetical protein
MMDRVWSPRVVACGRSVSQGRPGPWALAAGGLGEPAAEHLSDDGQARAGGGVLRLRPLFRALPQRELDESDEIWAGAISLILIAALFIWLMAH